MRGHDTQTAPARRRRRGPGAWAIPGATWFLIASSLAGCGSKNGLNLAKVSGTVTNKGEPLHHGTVVFIPDREKGTEGPPAMGVIAKDGTFLMTTDESGDGAIIGVHQVGIMALGDTPISGTEVTEARSEADEVKEFFANKAAKAAPKRKTAAEKKAGPTYKDRSGRVFPILVPENITKPLESGITVKVERGSNRLNIAILENGTVKVDR